MMKKISLLLLFFGIIVVSYVYWPFGGRNFDLKKSSRISVSDGGLLFSAHTNSKTIGEFLKDNNLVLAEKDYVFPPPDTRIFPGQNVTIRRAVPVVVDVDAQKIKIATLGTTVRDALNEAGVILSHADKISPDVNSMIAPDLVVKITRINFEEITVTEDMPFQTIEKEDSTVLWKKKETKQKGEKGIREKNYKVTYTNGKETNRALLGSKVTKPPVSQIEVVGTKIIVGKTQTGDATWYANGDEMTCASLDFAFGKYLRVTNRATGKSVIVKVNDSGPYGKGRIIDLNKKAFQKIAGLGEGVINVKVEEILN